MFIYEVFYLWRGCGEKVGLSKGSERSMRCIQKNNEKNLGISSFVTSSFISTF